MSKSVNAVTLLGNVGREPEVKATNSGTTVAKFSLATTESRKNGEGQWIDDTTWHSVVAFGRTAEVVRDYVHKGDRLYVEGRISYRHWEKDGQKHISTEILVDDVVLLGGRKPEREQPAVGGQPAAQPASSEVTDDDIPF